MYPMSSAQIAQMNGLYQNQYRGMGMMVPSAMMAENMAGGLMSRGMATAGPMMGGVASIMQFDPMSLGMSAASFGWNRMGMGVLGAGAMGIGAMGGAAAIGLGMQYAGGQIMQGAQNQYAFNNTMRANFNHIGAAGQGFGKADLSQISNTLQAMTHQYGPSGEANSFGELTKLAANMGRMGLGGSAVRDAQDFSKKFKEMVSTLKTVATELGTSLEGAQELLSASRGSGIFKGADQLKFSGAIRQYGLAGGLAQSELTGMANIGSRISRSVGGLGRSGAFAGMKALGQIGTATQIGALSEEDIYNATGATGAEGRAAMATEMLQNSANFMRTGKGRYFLASVAGKDGKINHDAAAEYMLGGVGTGQTSRMAHENLNGIGRANFIRNEGRLRGAAMEEFGAMMPTMALMNWGRQRGIDINNMDDRSMLFAQRQLGMGRDEMDAAVKMAAAMPELLAEQRRVKNADGYASGVARHNKTTGVQGFKTQLDHIRHGIEGKLQKIGSDMFDEGSNMIEGFFNKMSGEYARTMNVDLERYHNAIKSGGGMGSMESYLKNTASGTGVMGVSLDRIKAQGSIDGQRASAKFAKADDMTKKFVAGGFGDALMGSYMRGEGGDDALGRRANVAKLLKAKADAGDASAKELYARYKAGSPEERSALVASLENEAGIKGENTLANKFKDLYGTNSSTSGFATERDRHQALGERALGASTMTTGQSAAGYAARTVLGLGGFSLAEGLTNMAMGNGWRTDFTDAAANAASRYAGFGADRAAVGARLASKGGIRDINAVESGDAGAINRMQNELQTITKGKAFKDLDDTVKADVLNRKELIASAMITKELKAQNLDEAKLSNEQKTAIARKAMEAAGFDEDGPGGFKNAGAGHFNTLSDKRKMFLDMHQENMSANLREMGLKVMQDSDRMKAEMVDSGFAQARMGGKDGKQVVGVMLTAKTRAALQKGLGDTGIQIGELATKAAEGFVVTGDYKKDKAALAELTNTYQQLGDNISELGIDKKQALAKLAKGTELGSMAAESAMREQRLGSLQNSFAKQFGAAGSREAGVAALFGVRGDRGLMKKLAAAGDGGVDEILKNAGITADMLEGTTTKADLKSALEAARSGKTGKAADLANRAIENASPELREQIKKAQNGEDNPLLKSIDKNGGQTNKFLEALVKKTLSAEEFAAVMKNNDNPEKKQ